MSQGVHSRIILDKKYYIQDLLVFDGLSNNFVVVDEDHLGLVNSIDQNKSNSQNSELVISDHNSQEVKKTKLTEGKYILRRFIPKMFPTTEKCEACWKNELKSSITFAKSGNFDHVLKLIQPNILDGDLSSVPESFKQKFALLYRYEPNIVPLNKWFRRGKTKSSFVPKDFLSRLVLPLCRCVKKAHNEGIVHRDLNPKIIYVSESENKSPLPFVASWKTAYFFSDEYKDQIPPSPKSLQDLPDGYDPIYTPGFYAPEISMGKQPLVASDIFSLASIACYLITNGFTRSEPENLQDFVLEPKKIQATLPKELNLVIKRATDFNPSKRYNDMDKFIEDIAAVINENYTILEYLYDWEKENQKTEIVKAISLVFDYQNGTFSYSIPLEINKMIFEEDEFFKFGRDMLGDSPVFEKIAPIDRESEQFFLTFSVDNNAFMIHEGRNQNPTLMEGEKLKTGEWIALPFNHNLEIENVSGLKIRLVKNLNDKN